MFIFSITSLILTIGILRQFYRISFHKLNFTFIIFLSLFSFFSFFTLKFFLSLLVDVILSLSFVSLLFYYFSTYLFYTLPAILYYFCARIYILDGKIHPRWLSYSGDFMAIYFILLSLKDWLYYTFDPWIIDGRILFINPIIKIILLSFFMFFIFHRQLSWIYYLFIFFLLALMHSYLDLDYYLLAYGILIALIIFLLSLYYKTYHQEKTLSHFVP